MKKELENHLLGKLSVGNKSTQSDVISFEEWAEGWYVRHESDDWISSLQAQAKYKLTRPDFRDFKQRADQIRAGKFSGGDKNHYSAKELELAVNKLKRDSFKSLYGQIIARINVLLNLKIVVNGKLDYNDHVTNVEEFQQMLEYLFGTKKLFKYLSPKEVELFEAILSVIDTSTLDFLNKHRDNWECIALTDREKICDILHYLVWELDWDESHFANLGLVPRASIHPNRFRIIGRSYCDYDDSSYKDRVFSDYDIRLLYPKEYRLSYSLDCIYSSIEDIARYAPESDYAGILDRATARVDKIRKDLERQCADWMQIMPEPVDKLFEEE